MIKPDFETGDDALEFAAQLVEQMSFREIAGIANRRKRVREDAALRGETIRETKKEMAALIRAFKDRVDLSPITKLREAENLTGMGYDDSMFLVSGGWQLAAKGWVKVSMEVECSGNTVPPPVHFSVQLTDKGRAILAEADADVERPEQVFVGHPTKEP